MHITNLGCVASLLVLAQTGVADLPTYVDTTAIDAAIPTPSSVLGYRVGDDAVRYDVLVRYLETLADASDRVTMQSYGTTHEGRSLYYLTITSPENHDRLEDIRLANAKLADPRLLEGDAEADQLVGELPGIAWLSYCIHGDEISPTDSAMLVAYLLAADGSADTTRLLDELVVHIDPLQNPDGRERYLAQLQTLRGQVLNHDVQAMQHAGLWSAGRGNHYLFDMNRDWLTQSQPETVGRTTAILHWHPHLLIDSHEMGSLDTYLFDPPREPLNSNISPRQLQWRRLMSSDQAAAFDEQGWSYYTGEWYEEWYPGYTNAWATLIGAIGLLYEQASVNAAAVRQPAGNVMTYREAVEHNFVSSMANLETLRVNRLAILRDYLSERKAPLMADGGGEVYLIAPGPDRSLHADFLDVMERHGIEYVIASAAVDADDVVDIWGERSDRKTLPAGTIVIRSTQPQRALLRALLEFDPRMKDEFLHEERHDLENDHGSHLYDVTAWNLSMAYGLEAYVATRVADVNGADREIRETAPVPGDGRYGWLIPVDDSAAYRAIAHLTAAGVRVRAANKPFTIAGRAYGRGTALVRANENDTDAGDRIRRVVEDSVVEVIAVDSALSETRPDLGGGEFMLLHEPRVAIASQWPVSTQSFGHVWFLLDNEIGMRVSPVNIQNLGRIDLRPYNVLVLPSAGRLASVLGDSGMKRLRTWVESGGTLIAIGGSASALTDDDAGFSSVRRRRDVLDSIDVYDEYVDREWAARRVTVSTDDVWGRELPVAPAEEEESKPDQADDDEQRRNDEWARRFSPSGVVVAGRLDPEHWLSFGLDERLPLLVSGSTVFMSKPPAQTAVRVDDVEGLRLSGLLWPEARRRLARSAYVTRERVGNGQVILFAHEPYFRAQWKGTRRILLNAVILGPGFGTSQPVPW